MEPRIEDDRAEIDDDGILGQQARAQLLTLPQEILEAIVSYLDVKSLLAVQQSCQRLLLLDNPLLWRRHCRQEYQYWHSTHNFDELLKAPAAEQPWRELLATRKKLDHTISETMENIISLPVRRISRLQVVANEVEDAKDVLLKMHDCSNDALDVLARRYWVNEALGSVERMIALQEWKNLSDGQDVPLERALGAFDLFICERPPESLDQITAHLDMLAELFVTNNPGQHDLTPRKRACTLITWMRSCGFRGTSQDTYYRTQNSLISVVLCDATHQSIPIVSVAIYCCLARRLGMDVQPCGFPGHVLAIVTAPLGYNLDGEFSSDTIREVMYLDPFSNSDELTVAQLRAQLTDMGAPPARHAQFMQPMSTDQMIIRIAENISHLPRHNPAALRSILPVLVSAAPEALQFHGHYADATSALQTTLYPNRAAYAAGWAKLIAPRQDTAMLRRAVMGEIGENLNLFLQAFEPDFRLDMPLITRYIIPLLSRLPRNPNADEAEEPAIQLDQAGQDFLNDYMRHIVQEDNTSPDPSPRFGVPETNQVRYRIGQVFRHGRYNYLGAITGWDTQCRASAEWMRQMNVDNLSQGRAQCFYHIVADDGSTRYVAEENIELVYSNSNGGYVDAPVVIPKGLEKLAGRWFKRWDKNRGRFVSNITEEYPDD